MTEHAIDEEWTAEELEGLDEEEIVEAVQEGLDSLIDFQQVNVDDVITLTARLAQVLAEEADLLEQMKVSDITNLQKEKIMLTKALELMKKQIARNPDILEEMDEQQRDDLHSVVMVFNEILEENYKRISMARAVNRRIVDAISDVVKEQSTKDTYDKKGQANSPAIDSVCVTLNEKV